jgi:hypothetical protein
MASRSDKGKGKAAWGDQPVLRDDHSTRQHKDKLPGMGKDTGKTKSGGPGRGSRCDERISGWARVMYSHDAAT